MKVVKDSCENCQYHYYISQFYPHLCTLSMEKLVNLDGCEMFKQQLQTYQILKK